jgi:hypothetical protein
LLSCYASYLEIEKGFIDPEAKFTAEFSVIESGDSSGHYKTLNRLN